jgi:hypothetical protein
MLAAAVAYAEATERGQGLPTEGLAAGARLRLAAKRYWVATLEEAEHGRAS